VSDSSDPFSPFENGEETTSRTDDRDGWTPMLPVPPDAPPLDRALLRRCAGGAGFSATAQWEYRTSLGELLMVVVRYDRVSGVSTAKGIRPFTFGHGWDGVRQWRPKAIAKDRPLYRLDALARQPDAPVLVVEGEKAADAAAERFLDFAVTTSSGGAHAASKSDWRPLAGRRIILWPDADKAGRRYVEEVAGLLQDIGSSTVSMIEVPAHWPEGWDLADELPSGVTDAMLAAMIAGAGNVLDEPLPLFPPLAQGEPYPAEALGPILSSAATAIAHKIQVPAALAAQSVLAVAALVAQAHADVRLPLGRAGRCPSSSSP
jgi:hypothetical protein